MTLLPHSPESSTAGRSKGITFYDTKELKKKCATALQHVGLDESDALETAESLVLADSRGLSSHGVSRLAVYMGRIKSGKMSPHTQVTVLHESPSAMLLDGNNGVGAPVALRAMDMVSKKAQETGIAFGTVRRSNHFGMAGHIAERANTHGLIGYAASNGAARMPAHGARKPVFGTSPFACAIPTGSGGPIVVDMATCVVARGKIIMASRAGEPIPEGWALDEDGQPTTDADRALAGSVIPFAGPKGSAIALLIEIFSGVLAGDTWGRGVQDLYVESSGASGTSHSLMAIDIEAITCRSSFEANMSDLVEQIKDSPASPDTPVYLPGEREQLAQSEAEKNGVQLAFDVIEELNSLFHSLAITPLTPYERKETNSS